VGAKVDNNHMVPTGEKYGKDTGARREQNLVIKSAITRTKK